MPLLLNPADWEELMDARRRRADSVSPVRWCELLDRTARGRVLPLGIRTLWLSGTVISWHLWPLTIMAAALGRPLIYLCWGVDYHTGIRRHIARAVLRRAQVVLVNDPRTAAEVERVASVKALQIPYLVDADFFTPPPTSQRKDFLFCPGSNDRDGEVLLALAQSGHRVKWLNNSLELTEIYKGRHPRLELLSFITFEELRDLYHRCKAVILPLSRDVHAAGQTTALEGLASGCPVVMSNGRTAEIFESKQLVTIVYESDTASWEKAIEHALAADAANPFLSENRAQLISQRHGVAAVEAAMRKVLRSVSRNPNR